MAGERKNVSSYGETATEVTWDRRLCIHVGHSKNKPFCDGAHRDAGFEAP